MKYRVKVGEEFEVEVEAEVPPDDPGGETSEPEDPNRGPEHNKPAKASSPEGVLAGYATVQRARVIEQDARVRVWLTAAIVLGVGLALALTAFRGWTTGDFNAVQQVWNVGSVLLTSVTTFYFVKRDADRGEKDTSSG